jgi:hypothetical protein
MPVKSRIQPPPYQDTDAPDRGKVQRWDSWYRQFSDQVIDSYLWTNFDFTGSSIGDIEDVTIASAANGDILTWNGTAWGPASENTGLELDIGAGNDIVWHDGTFFLDQTGNEILQFSHQVNATHYLRFVQGSSTNGFMLFTPSSEAECDFFLATKQTGSGRVVISDASRNEIHEFLDVASAANQLRTTNAIATAKPVLSATGTDTNIGLSIQPKGTGVIKAANQNMGPTTAVTASTHTHAIDERYLLCDTTSNAITVDLLAAATAGDGYRLDIKIVDATNAVTVDGNGSETIDGATTATLSTQYENISLVCDGSNWHIL